MEARTANRESPVPFDARGGGGAEAFFVIAATASGGSINKATVLPSWALWFWQGVLGLIAITSGGLTATFRSVFIRALRTTERNVGDGPTVVGALVLAGRSGSDRAHVRGTDGYISLCDYSRAMDSRA